MNTLNFETRIQSFCAALQALGPTAIFDAMSAHPEIIVGHALAITKQAIEAIEMGELGTS